MGRVEWEVEWEHRISMSNGNVSRHSPFQSLLKLNYLSTKQPAAGRSLCGDVRCQVGRSCFPPDKFPLDKLIFLRASWAVKCDPNVVKWEPHKFLKYNSHLTESVVCVCLAMSNATNVCQVGISKFFVGGARVAWQCEKIIWRRVWIIGCALSLSSASCARTLPTRHSRARQVAKGVRD